MAKVFGTHPIPPAARFPYRVIYQVLENRILIHTDVSGNVVKDVLA